MLKLNPEQLYKQLNKKLYMVYLLLGNDPLLLKESRDLILQMSITHGFNEQHTAQVDSNTDWQAVFSFCRVISLFTSRKTLILELSENSLNTLINKRLNTLVGLLHNDLLLIVYSDKLTKTQKNTSWFTKLAKKAVLVTCQTPNQVHLAKWVTTRAYQYNLQFDKSACQLLCHFYEGNLLALAQILDQLSLLWPEGNKVTLSCIKRLINDTSNFTPFHWIDALLSAKSRRALHILQKLLVEGSEPIILIHTLQRELLLLITIKRQLSITPLFILFDKQRIWKNRQPIITEAINRLSYDQLRQAIHFLTQIKLSLKQDCDQLISVKLKNLSLFLCNKSLANIFIND